MKTTRKILSVILALVMAFACSSIAFAVGADYSEYNMLASDLENLKYNKAYQQLCIPGYAEYIDAVLSENEIAADLDASEQDIIDAASANIAAAKAALITDKFLKAPADAVDEAFKDIDELFAVLDGLTADQQAEVDALKAQVNEMKADRAGITEADLAEVIAKLETIKAYLDTTKPADYSAYDLEYYSFSILKENKAYQIICVADFADFIDAVLAETALPKDLTLADQELIYTAIEKIKAAKNALFTDEYLVAPAADVDAAVAQAEAFLAGLEVEADKQAFVDEYAAKVAAFKAQDKKTISITDLADFVNDFEAFKITLDDTRPADYTQYAYEVSSFEALKYNKGYLETRDPAYIDYIDQVLAETELPDDLQAKDQYLIDAAVAKILEAKEVVLSAEFDKAPVVMFALRVNNAAASIPAEAAPAEECDCFCHSSNIVSRLAFSFFKAISSIFGVDYTCRACADAH